MIPYPPQHIEAVFDGPRNIQDYNGRQAFLFKGKVLAIIFYIDNTMSVHLQESLQ